MPVIEKNREYARLLLCAFAILIWGWFNNLLILAIALVFILVISRLVKWRWELEDADFHRIADFSAIVVLLSALYLYSVYSVQGLYVFLRWLPIFFILLVAAQWYSLQSKIPMSALLLSLRRNNQKVHYFDISYVYLLLCLFSAAAAQEKSASIYFAVSVIVMSVLWMQRPRRYQGKAGIMFTLLIVFVGYIGHNGIFYTQQHISSIILAWISSNWRANESHSVTTAIGQVGELKLSDRILFRVNKGKDGKENFYLRLASYSLYNAGSWHSAFPEFKNQSALAKGRWRIQESRANAQLEILGLQGGVQRRLLPLPLGTKWISGLDSIQLRKNAVDVIEIEDAAEFLRFKVGYQELLNNSLPHAADLLVPDNYQKLMKKLRLALDLDNNIQDHQKINKISEYFAKNFRYSLVQQTDLNNYAPLASFLLQDKKGHCEYFATAGALLLRSVGIPTRYVTGFSVQEYSQLEQAYVVRYRHAHAWLEAYVDGNWIELDFTPAIWAEMEAQHAAWWQPVYDLFSNLYFRFNHWRWYGEKGVWSTFGIYIIAVLSIILIWRLRRKKRVSNPLRQKDQTQKKVSKTPIQKILQQLDSISPRSEGETLINWLLRSEFKGKQQLLERIIPLYYESRYNPKGLSNTKEQCLQQEIELWKKQYLAHYA